MKGLLIVLSGPSGAGKGTVLKNVLSTNDKLKCSISVTTRPIREGEVEGVNYFFRTVDEYKKMLHNGEFLEHEEVYGNLYGTPKEYVDSLRDNGYDVILEIDVKGAMAVKNKEKDAVTIFLLPKDKKTLEQRLVGRNTETQDSLDTRLTAAQDEIKQAGEYQYIVINDNVEDCAKDIMDIITASKHRAPRYHDFINSFR